ncbi:uncharacterized protein At4g37920 isoform X1 [Arachis duranensis]|uniref:Uncharacterized protein At4g37920 isoform X1 n=1 Tax=Arachis duranensis TaxID=130453 RepID=A0A9C6THP9_ARADU|nr:uncharacterized protein At4g37920 isoform X1 [Arachis duranensis]XP_052108989.1 uncharacterized protein At4g37920 isoform X1 [Arachis duranensis]XP_052108990.1 uncharacterized protein At4g37920 isoform X1 [Arachis duranensis]
MESHAMILPSCYYSVPLVLSTTQPTPPFLAFPSKTSLSFPRLNFPTTAGGRLWHCLTVIEGLSSASSSGSSVDVDDGSGGGGGKEEVLLDESRMVRVCDKLIGVFMVDKPTPTDWRRLLAFSREWDSIRPHFFKRCQDRADVEADPTMKERLLRLGRKLKEIDEDVQRHNDLLEVIKGDPSGITDIVAKRRKDFTKEFFVHLHTVAESYYDNAEMQNELAKLGNICLAAVQAYDDATESMEKLNEAELKFQDIFSAQGCITSLPLFKLVLASYLNYKLDIILHGIRASKVRNDRSLTRSECKSFIEFHCRF